MDNTTIKFVLILGAVLLVMRWASKSEKFVAFNETMKSRFEGPARYVPVGAVQHKRAASKTKRAPAVSHGSALLRASVPVNQPKGTGAAANLLPKPAADAGFGQFAPNPKELTGQNFVDASRWVSLGAMTSRRNINRDIRSDIPIPKNNGLSPWNQSTIEQQPSNKPLDCP